MNLFKQSLCESDNFVPHFQANGDYVNTLATTKVYESRLIRLNLVISIINYYNHEIIMLDNK